MLSDKDISKENGVNDIECTDLGVPLGTGMGNEQPEPSRHQSAARRGWGYRINKIFKIQSCYRGCSIQESTLAIWEQLDEFETTEQRLADKATYLRVNGWLSELEVEEIQRGAEYITGNKRSDR